jgi:hypothetical protein
MDWGSPIGFGKAGNNPYAMGALGVNALSGGTGLVGLLTQLLRGSNNPEQTSAFAMRAAATGAPVTSMPRTGEGLIPEALSKLGIMSPNVSASPQQMDLEKLVLEARQQKRMEDFMHYAAAITDIGGKYGPSVASSLWTSIKPTISDLAPSQAGPSMADMFDPSKIQSPELLREKHEADWLKIQQAHADYQDKMAEAAQTRASADEERATAAQTTQNRLLEAQTDREKAMDRAQNARQYGSIYGMIRSRRANVMGGDTVSLDQAESFLHSQETAGVDPYTAYNQAIERFPVLASTTPTAPMPTGSSVPDWMKSAWNYMTGPAQAPTTPSGAAPIVPWEGGH